MGGQVAEGTAGQAAASPVGACAGVGDLTTFRCGHPRTPENTVPGVSRGRPYAKCRTCKQGHDRAFRASHAMTSRERLLKAIRATEYDIRQREEAGYR
jgi:hypothetical protein